MVPELQLFQSLLETLKEQQKDIAKLQVSCVTLRNILAEIDPKWEIRYKELFAQASALPRHLAEEQIDALIEQILQQTKTGHDPVH